MKKFLVLILSALMLLSMVACGKDGGSEKSQTSSLDASTPSEKPAVDLGRYCQEPLDGAAKVDQCENDEWAYQIIYSKYSPDAQVTIGNYLGTSASIVIPDTIDGYPVTKLANNNPRDSFIKNMDMKEVTHIEFPDTLYFITGGMLDDTAWYENQPDGPVYAGRILYKYKGTMVGDTSFEVADGTTGISGSAFSGKSGLKELIMPDTVVHIGAYAFKDCSNLERVRLSKELRYVGTHIFEDCDLLKELYVPQKVYLFAETFGESEIYTIYYEGDEAAWNKLSKRSRLSESFNMQYNQVMPE